MMRQINLLPPEIAQRRRAREITLLIGAAGLVLVGLLVLVFLIETARIAGERRHLNDVKGENAALQSKVNELQIFAQHEQQLQTKESLLAGLTQNEVRWSIVLNDLSIRIPSDVWLTTFTGSVTASTGAPQAGNQPLAVGTLSLIGSTFTHLDVAKYLARLADVPEFSFPYLTLSAKGGTATSPLVTFNSTVELSPAALRRNQPGGARKI
jgi:Tfp pilus assembly protein PilN